MSMVSMTCNLINKKQTKNTQIYLNEYKKIVKLFYMGILSIPLKERNKNGLCRIAIAFDRMVMIFFLWNL